MLVAQPAWFKNARWLLSRVSRAGALKQKWKCSEIVFWNGEIENKITTVTTCELKSFDSKLCKMHKLLKSTSWKSPSEDWDPPVANGSSGTRWTVHRDERPIRTLLAELIRYSGEHRVQRRTPRLKNEINRLGLAVRKMNNLLARFTLYVPVEATLKTLQRCAKNPEENKCRDGSFRMFGKLNIENVYAKMITICSQLNIPFYSILKCQNDKRWVHVLSSAEKQRPEFYHQL